MPYKNPMAQVYDDGKFEHVMDQALAMADWDGFAARAAASRSSGKWRGLGIATFLEWTGANVFEERVTLTVLADGVIEVFAAVNGMGQGIATSLAQLVVDVFDVPLENIRVVLGDTWASACSTWPPPRTASVSISNRPAPSAGRPGPTAAMSARSS